MEFLKAKTAEILPVGYTYAWDGETCDFVALAQAVGVLLITDDKAILRAFPQHCRSLDEAIKRGVKR